MGTGREGTGVGGRAGVAHGLAVVAGSADNPNMYAIGMRTLEIVAVN
ncbi:hypothetical protein OAM92_00230 [Acidimicrobiales bacterium]|nr:hypothetical protein [Acidimicrobiales bacterium]